LHPLARPNTQQRINRPVLFEFDEAEDEQLLALLSSVTDDAADIAETQTTASLSRRLTSSDLRKNSAGSTIPKELVCAQEAAAFFKLMNEYLVGVFISKPENAVWPKLPLLKVFVHCLIPSLLDLCRLWPRISGK